MSTKLAALTWLVLVAVLVVFLATPASAQGLEIRCPDTGLAAGICQNIAPVINLILQIVGAVVAFVLILWVIRLLH